MTTHWTVWFNNWIYLEWDHAEYHNRNKYYHGVAVYAYNFNDWHLSCKEFHQQPKYNWESNSNSICLFSQLVNNYIPRVLIWGYTWTQIHVKHPYPECIWKSSQWTTANIQELCNSRRVRTYGKTNSLQIWFIFKVLMEFSRIGNKGVH